jgi:collagenase-like PrtC family protease
MFPLDIPFVADGDYPDFLADHTKSLASVHFSLHDPSVADARQCINRIDRDTIISGLKKLDGVARFLLMNARLHTPDKYFNASDLATTAHRLETLLDAVDLNGIIFADPYFLQTFSDTHPDIASRLEAVPSVNANLDSADKTFAMLDMIDGTAFKAPTKLVLDRSLNRDIQRLAKTSARMHKACPNIKLHLLANEGCLFQCPYKPAHDAHRAMVNEGLCLEHTFAMNRDFGCVRRLLDNPGSMLASPFIRPEDMERYEPHVDGIKLCGRTKGTAFLQRILEAYLKGEYTGNLLDLMDAMGDLSDRMTIPNHCLPNDFADHVTTCAKDCRKCNWCEALMKTTATRNDPDLIRL